MQRLKVLDISGNKIRYINKDALKKRMASTLIRNYNGEIDSSLDLIY